MDNNDSCKIVSHSVQETFDAGAAMARDAKPGECYVLTGDLGAGKTHFTKGFAAGLGVTEDITSPTFAIVEQYDSGRLELLHWDLYRLEDEWELEDVDWYALTESDAVSLVEWGDKFPAALPDEYTHIDFKVDAETGVRTMSVSHVG